MTVRRPLVQVSGAICELPTGDTIDLALANAVSNVIATPTAVAEDTSYILVSYLSVSSDLTVSGNVMVTG